MCRTEIEPVLQHFHGWQCSLDGVRRFEELPENAQYYIQFVENYLGVPVKMVSTGPEREKLVTA
jgi:adenylosuccinate synthase